MLFRVIVVEREPPDKVFAVAVSHISQHGLGHWARVVLPKARVIPFSRFDSDVCMAVTLVPVKSVQLAAAAIATADSLIVLTRLEVTVFVALTLNTIE
jgi:hypothetical protein